MTPYDRLKRLPLTAQPQIAAPMAAPAQQGMPLQWMQGVGGEGEGEQGMSGIGDISKLLGDYLKKRQGASAADAEAAWKAGGSL